MTDPPIKKEGFLFFEKTAIFIFVCTDNYYGTQNALKNNYYAPINKRTSQKKLLLGK